MRDRSAFSKPKARRSAVTSSHENRHKSRQEDSQAHGGRHYCSSNKAWGSDVLVENDAAAPKSCLSHLEMCTPTAAGGLSPTDPFKDWGGAGT